MKNDVRITPNVENHEVLENEPAGAKTRPGKSKSAGFAASWMEKATRINKITK